MTEPTISIAMATFNGAKYIQDQLNSLAAQTRLPYELVVGDDGSTDSTLAIVENFAVTAPFPVRTHRNPERLGYGGNFLTAASLCKGEWIAFCDQDDVWLPNRLAGAAEAICVEDAEVMMVVQAAEVVDCGLNPIGRRLPDIPYRVVKPRNFHYGLWVPPGFSMTIRGSLLRALSWRERPTQAHDRWVFMLANALGTVVLLPESAALFRRHVAALTGSRDRHGFGQSVSYGIKKAGARYQEFNQVAVKAAACLRRLSAEAQNSEWTERLIEGATLFDQLGSVQKSRAEIYLSKGTLRRLLRLGSVLRHGGYFGHPFVRMGARALMKDLAMCFVFALPTRALERVSAD